MNRRKKLDQNVVGQIGLCQQAIEGLDRQKTGIEREYEELHRRLSMKLEETERAKAEYVEMKQRMQKASVTETCVCLDQELAENMLSDDAELSTRAQIMNPWLTQHYNREREKLFGSGVAPDRKVYSCIE